MCVCVFVQQMLPDEIENLYTQQIVYYSMRILKYDLCGYGGK